MSRFLICSFVAVISIGFARADDAANKKALDAMQGVWKATSFTVDGKDLPKPDGKDFILTIKGNEFIPSSNPKDVGIVTIDASKKPMEIDLKENNGKVSKGIFVQDGDTLKLTMSNPDKDRPTDFTKGMVMTLKREKK